ncbi:MAG: hypothetical protein SGILL_004807 [Bacillariaceae sp.]
MLKINGDEFAHWITDTEDYMVVRDDLGVYAYAEVAEDGQLVPSKTIVGKDPPKDKPPKGANIHRQPSDDNQRMLLERRGLFGDSSTRSGSLRGSNNQRRRRATSTVGTLKNLVILLKFRDHNRRALPSKDQINVLMNSEVEHRTLAPTGSLKMVYWENSYRQLTIESTVTDWIRVSNRERHYAAGTSGVGLDRTFQEALTEVLDELESQNFDFSDFDQDGDSHIDSITFLTSGYGAEWGGGKKNEVFECSD